MQTASTQWRLAAVIATAAFAMSVAACGGDSSDSPSASSTQTRVTSSESAPSAPGDVSGSESPSAGGGADPGSGAKTAPSETFSEQPGRDIDLRTQQFPITAYQAVSIATDKVGDGTLHAIELDYSDSGGWTWEIKILKDGVDHKVVIDPILGTIKQDKEDKTNDQEKPVDPDSPMSIDEAMQLALAQRKGSVGEWKLEYDDGRVAYQFDITQDGKTKEVTVDVETKQVTVDK